LRGRVTKMGRGISEISGGRVIMRFLGVYNNFGMGPGRFWQGGGESSGVGGNDLYM